MKKIEFFICISFFSFIIQAKNSSPNPYVNEARKYYLKSTIAKNKADITAGNALLNQLLNQKNSARNDMLQISEQIRKLQAQQKQKDSIVLKKDIATLSTSLEKRKKDLAGINDKEGKCRRELADLENQLQQNKKELSHYD